MAQLDDICQARIGTTLNGKWTLERLLGQGGMAAVYVGVHKIGRRDAIKILHPEVAASTDLKARFQREAETTNRFTHPAAVEVRDSDVSEDGCPFLVMELLEGESLGERARRLGEISVSEILAHVEELCDVLEAAHREGIVHRDVKLDNLFVTSDGKLKVLDFGIARVRSSGPALTMTGTRLGTTAYMPPEQIRGGDIDGRADLFAVGATMFRLLAKRRIHEAATESELVIKMASEPAPKIGSVANVPEHLALIVDRALAFHARDRYPNALTMQEDVRAVRRGEPPPYASARLAHGDISASAGAFTAFEPTGVAPAPSGFATEATRAAGPRAAPSNRVGSAPPRRPPPRPTMHGAPRPVVASGAGPTAGPAEITEAAPGPSMRSRPTMGLGIVGMPAPPQASGAKTSAETLQVSPGDPTFDARPRSSPPPRSARLTESTPPPSAPPSSVIDRSTVRMASTPPPVTDRAFSSGSSDFIATPSVSGSGQLRQSSVPPPAFGAVGAGAPRSMGYPPSPAFAQSTPLPHSAALPAGAPAGNTFPGGPPPSNAALEGPASRYEQNGPPSGYGTGPSSYATPYGPPPSSTYVPTVGFAAQPSAGPHGALGSQPPGPWSPASAPNQRSQGSTLIAALVGIGGIVILGGAVGSYFYLSASASGSKDAAAHMSDDDSDSSASPKDSPAPTASAKSAPAAPAPDPSANHPEPKPTATVSGPMPVAVPKAPQVKPLAIPSSVSFIPQIPGRSDDKSKGASRKKK